jgi:FMN phosphatase YigB (HAD superfamily)
LLIIFDLDDTLIDTSGALTPRKLEEAVRCMVRAGLQVPSLLEATARLKYLDAEAESARVALQRFAEEYSAEEQVLAKGIDAVYGPAPPSLPVPPVEGALQVLEELHQRQTLALVTSGVPEVQRTKLEKAGIDTALFSSISICEGVDKKPDYACTSRELGFDASDVLVCGDRVARDLVPAKELGFTTVHIRRGRGRFSSGGSAVDFEIFLLEEIKPIIDHLMSRCHD